MPGGPSLHAGLRSLRLTTRGFVFLGATLAVALGAAFSENDHLVLLAGALAGILVASALFTVLGARGLELERALPASVHAHGTFATRVAIRNRGRFAPAFALEVEERLLLDGRPAATQRGPIHLPLAAPGDRCETTAQATAVRRGQSRFAPSVVKTSFPPGLVTCRVEIAAPQDLLIYPREGVLERRVANPYLARTVHPDLFPTACAPGDDEFAGVREWRPGDNLRRIHWKLLARMPDRLHVREYEDARAREAVILLDTHMPAGRDPRRAPRLERAISFAGALARSLLERNYGVRVLAFAPDLADIRLVPERGALADLDRALALLTPSRDRTLLELAALAGPPRDEVYFVLAIDAVPALPLPPRRTVTIPAETMRELMYYAA